MTHFYHKTSEECLTRINLISDSLISKLNTFYKIWDHTQMMPPIAFCHYVKNLKCSMFHLRENGTKPRFSTLDPRIKIFPDMTSSMMLSIAPYHQDKIRNFHSPFVRNWQSPYIRQLIPLIVCFPLKIQ